MGESLPLPAKSWMFAALPRQLAPWLLLAHQVTRRRLTLMLLSALVTSLHAQLPPHSPPRHAASIIQTRAEDCSTSAARLDSSVRGHRLLGTTRRFTQRQGKMPGTTSRLTKQPRTMLAAPSRLPVAVPQQHQLLLLLPQHQNQH